MAIQINDVLKLASFKEADLLAGEKGINKKVKWVYLAETLPHIDDILKWISGGELLFIIGYGISNNIYSFSDIIHKANDKNVSGLVFFLGEYIESVPEETVNLCNKLNLPLITLPWHIKYIDATHEICQSITTQGIREKTIFDFLDSILFSESIPNEVIIERARAFNVDFNSEHRVIIIDIDKFNDYIETNSLTDEYMILALKTQLFETVEYMYNAVNVEPINMLRSDSVISLIPDQDIVDIDFELFYEKLNNQLDQFYKGLKVSIGIGNSYTDIDDLKKSYREALNVLKLQRLGIVKSNTYFYDDLQMYKLFCELDDYNLLNKYYPDKLNPIIQYDKMHDSNLLETLENYLNCDKSLNEAAKRMFIHRNTVKYRIDKVKEITSLNLNDMNTCFNLMFELRVYRFVKM